MKSNYLALLSLLGLMLLGACTTAPTGPDVMALPGEGRDFDSFRGDDLLCRDFAKQQTGGADGASKIDRETIGNVALGAAMGALAGVLIGDDSKSAGIGAGAGVLLGGAAGVGDSSDGESTMQRRYDNAYTQCMYAKGHKVPFNGSYSMSHEPVKRVSAVESTPAPSAGSLPPPPPPAGRPPPPPPAR